MTPRHGRRRPRRHTPAHLLARPWAAAGLVTLASLVAASPPMAASALGRPGAPGGALAAQSLPPTPQRHLVSGRVVQAGGGPVPWAGIAVAGTRREVAADDDGHFRLGGMPEGTHNLLVSARGFAAAEVTVTVPDVTGAPLVVVLAPDPVALAGLTVTGTMKSVSVASSPVKVNVVPQAVLRRSATHNLAEALQFTNGVTQQVECGVCYTNSLRINGMEGPYTAVLIDGMPLMTSLAAVYGLNGINPALVEQVEIIKGPASTLYGSEAMAGVVNVLTKDPRFSPRFAVDVSGSSDAEGNLDFALSSPPGDASAFVSGNVAYNQRWVDGNGDGFSDFPLTRRGILFGKLDLADGGRRQGTLAARYLMEDRFGGVERWTPALRGSDQVYGESIRTHRAEFLGSWLPLWSQEVRVEGSYALHDQDSWYGDTRYAARQETAVATLLWGGRRGRHDLLVGATARYQAYDDDTPATPSTERSLIPGLLAQDEFLWTPSLSVLGGVRADHHRAHGVILSPRLAARWSLGEWTALRLNAGTGFRVVNLFTEDHAALTGAREVVIASDLRPERSRSLTLNLNQVVEWGRSPMMIDVDVFHTRFTNKIRPDYDVDPRLIVYDNLRGHGVSRGVAITLNQNVDFDRFLYSLGVTVQEVYTADAGVRVQEFFAPAARVTLSATYNARRVPLSLDYTGTVTGPMRMPAYPEPFTRPERSPTWALHNVQGSWRVGEATQLYLAVKNIAGYVQSDALVDPSRPFGDHFDTAYVYGPLRGRHLMLGVRHGVAR